MKRFPTRKTKSLIRLRDAQADLSLCRGRIMSEGMFSHVAAHIYFIILLESVFVKHFAPYHMFALKII